MELVEFLNGLAMGLNMLGAEFLKLREILIYVGISASVVLVCIIVSIIILFRRGAKSVCKCTGKKGKK